MGLPADIVGFEIISDVVLPCGVTTRDYCHVLTQIPFRLIPGGELRRGFSENEEDLLRETLLAADDDDSKEGLAVLDSLSGLRPVPERRIAPFLLAPEPLSQAQLMELLKDDAPPSLGDMEGCLSLSVAEQIVGVLNGYGLRLPTDFEWEYSYRANTTTPFPWGCERPHSPWAPENEFGLAGMGEFAELCVAGWQAGDESTPCAEAARLPDSRPRVARGGAAEVWPWQGVAEWVTMLSAYRSTSKEHDGFIRIRPVCCLP